MSANRGIEILGLSLVLTSCTHSSGTASQPMARENVRLAQAQVLAPQGAPVLGTLNFEQMPNSVIITYRIEGLEPKSKYQILVQETDDCKRVDLSTANPLRQLRVNKSGVSENTFKTVDFSVSGENSLLGKTVVIVSQPAKTKAPVRTQAQARSPDIIQIACGRVEATSSVSQIE